MSRSLDMKSLLTIKVDILDLRAIDPHFRTRIGRDMVPVSFSCDQDPT
jgi:predicted nucleotidyltransferase